MAYTVTINGNANQTTEITYGDSHEVISLNDCATKVRQVIPKYSKITEVIASAEVEKGYSWTSSNIVLAWYEINGSRVSEEFKLKNGANKNINAYITGYFDNLNNRAGAFGALVQILKLHFKEPNVPVTFVTRDKKLIYTYEKPTFNANVQVAQMTNGKYGGRILYDGTDFGTQLTRTLEVDIATQNHTITAIPNEGYYFTNWSNIENSSYSSISDNTINVTLNDNVISANSTNFSGKAYFYPITYNLTIKNYDDSILLNGNYVSHWSTIKECLELYNYDDTIKPTRPPDDNYHYIFNGYDVDLNTVVTGPVTLVAQYIAIPHSMSYALTAEGRRHHTCSGCEYNFLERSYDLCQENLFHFSDWAESDCAKVASGDGTMSYNIPEGSISIIGSGDFYTAYGGTSNYYTISIIPGEEYVLDYSINSTDGKQAFVFFYDETGNAVNGVGLTVPHIGKYDGTPIQFIAPEGASKVCFRFGIRGNSTATIKNISFCNIKNKKIFNEITHNKLRKVYFSDEIVSQPLSPRRRHYNFDNWYNNENYSEKIEFPLYLEESLTIYTKWIQKKMFLGGDSVLLFFGDKKLSLLLGDQLLL